VRGFVKDCEGLYDEIVEKTHWHEQVSETKDFRTASYFLRYDRQGKLKFSSMKSGRQVRRSPTFSQLMQLIYHIRILFLAIQSYSSVYQHCFRLFSWTARLSRPRVPLRRAKRTGASLMRRWPLRALRARLSRFEFFGAYPLVDIRQAVPCRAARGSRISVERALAPSLKEARLRLREAKTERRAGGRSRGRCRGSTRPSGSCASAAASRAPEATAISFLRGGLLRGRWGRFWGKRTKATGGESAGNSKSIREHLPHRRRVPGGKKNGPEGPASTTSARATPLSAATGTRGGRRGHGFSPRRGFLFDRVDSP